MATSRPNLERDLKRAQNILKMMQEEKILSLPTHPLFKRVLTRARNLTTLAVKSQQMVAPGLTSCAATTFLGVGLCQELSQRFLLEYCDLYKARNLSYIFLFDEKEKDNHMFVFIGDVNVPDNLIVGRGTVDTTANPENAISLKKFLTANRAGIIADPLLGLAAINDSEIAAFKAYCDAHALTQVVGVRSFVTSPDYFFDNTKMFKENAKAIATTLRPMIDFRGLSAQIQAEVKKTAAEIRKENLKETKVIEFKKESAPNYLIRLNEVLGAGIVRIYDKESKVGFPTFWLKQLKKGAITELSTELGVDEDKLRI